MRNLLSPIEFAANGNLSPLLTSTKTKIRYAIISERNRKDKKNAKKYWLIGEKIGVEKKRKLLKMILHYSREKGIIQNIPYV
jgi:hypothetical protein